jgi:hypothetical protein
MRGEVSWFRLLSLVPGDNWRKTNLVHARKEGKEGEDERCPDELVLVEEGDNVKCLSNGQVLTSRDWRTSFSRASVSRRVGDLPATGAAPFDCEATFLLRSSSDCASAPVVRAVLDIVTDDACVVLLPSTGRVVWQDV